jgi:hypothetical protein
MRSVRAVTSPLVLLLGLAAGACGPSAPPAPAAPAAAAPAEDDGPVVGPPDVAWKDMTGPQKGRYMAKVVVPAMGPLFKEFDAERFADFGCITCHGDGAMEHKFDMPNPAILPLPGPDDPAAFAPIYEKQPKMVEFMGGKVMPEMARLLGKAPFDYQHPAPDQFGCLGCHTKAPKAAAAP